MIQNFGMNQAVSISYPRHACSFPAQGVIAPQHNTLYTQNCNVQGYGARVKVAMFLKKLHILWGLEFVITKYEGVF